MVSTTASMAQRRIVSLASIAAALFALAIFLKIAWVTDDAYIIFRSIEQLFAGHGPRWNPHERVQVFTSPLWFGYLNIFRVFSADVFLNAVLGSAILFVATLVLLRKSLGSDVKWLTAIALLLCSNGFFDYTSSGLENPLAYFLIIIYLHVFFKLPTASPEDDTGTKTRLRALWLCFGLILTCRHDLVTIFFLPTAYAVWMHRRRLSLRQWFVVLMLGLSPLIIWSLFSLLYYGTALPNTAYAKLNTGFSRARLLRWGLDYLRVCSAHDTITVVGIFAAIVALIRTHRVHARVLAAGMLVNFLYIVWVGGDFMIGRFLSFAYLLAVVATLHNVDLTEPRGGRAILVILIVCAGYAVFYPHTPVNSPLDHSIYVERPTGAIDERGYYSEATLRKWLRHEGPYFPKEAQARVGFMFAQRPRPVVERGVIGYFGYWAGLDIIVIDSFALADPLLARLPADQATTYRIGHFRRKLPQGYLESFMSGRDEILDPDLRAYYGKLKIVTQSKMLFGWTRLKTIVAMNLGRYDHYLDAAVARY